jgi:hypothetical protein
MLTGIILAGGFSTRMGKDKALIFEVVNRLESELLKSGCGRVFVMCGTRDRMHLFEQECMVDLGSCLAESLAIIIEGIAGEIQLAPCDAYLADAELFASLNGIPVDDFGNRQPLMARIVDKSDLVKSKKIQEMFAKIPTCEGGKKARNFNSPEDLKEIEYLLGPNDR